MTDQEFEILEELYFIQSYDQLLESTGFQTNDLKVVLAQLLVKGWVKCFYPLDKEIPFERDLYEMKFSNYYYIATKAGLLAHNVKE